MGNELVEYSQSSVSILDESNPRSIINLVPRVMSENIKKIPPEFFNMDEDSLHKKLKPSLAIKRLRSSFWFEYNKVMSSGANKIKMSNVCNGVCSEDYFQNEIATNPIMLSWIILPKHTYEIILDEGWESSMTAIRRILDMPDTNPKTGKPDYKMLDLKIKVFKMFDERKHGGVVQKQMNLHLTGKDARDMFGQVDEDSVSTLDQQIHNLQKRYKEITKVKDVKEEEG